MSNPRTSASLKNPTSLPGFTSQKRTPQNRTRSCPSLSTSTAAVSPSNPPSPLSTTATSTAWSPWRTIVAVSVDYRRVPEHPIPIPYEDSWAALRWVASHSDGDGPEEWINSHADLARVFLGGDSAGANISHNIGIRFGEEKLGGIDIVGIVLAQPYFWGKEPIANEPGSGTEKRAKIDELWDFAAPGSSGNDDPLINPLFNPKLAKLGCKKVLVAIAEKDFLRDRGWFYYELLGKSGWGGAVEIMEAKGEVHLFHLFNPTCDNAMEFLERVASFLNLG